LLTLLLPTAVDPLVDTNWAQPASIRFEEEWQGRKNGRLHHTSAHHTIALFLLHPQTAKNPTIICLSLFKVCVKAT